ncbi:hypothetical protein SAICODRAFT_133075 [Saitoella complicata NRRL Y-17804]|uniref:uncharacterized protein n=1 Tax=Saitoella complicata (strain BCRC 22490 / CBS 7301 / JCM 7358 / NBRC 10748 / NRRL Y-17804) TaxID=698492 RepID=UPI000866E8FA|nr:uncharacterized protein SAICODRAFT_133075 [Saitoella complicata NRRL Y-17804]ODQ52304.1 hypothetical protein SAICODRAFT_133075 [Saitoella complicata NRRL Y-17804]
MLSEDVLKGLLVLVVDVTFCSWSSMVCVHVTTSTAMTVDIAARKRPFNSTPIGMRRTMPIYCDFIWGRRRSRLSAAELDFQQPFARVRLFMVSRS